MKKRVSVSMLALAFVFTFVFAAGQAIAKDMTATDYKAAAEKVITDVSVSEAKTMLDKGGCIFLDCRTAKEYKMGHVPGSINMERGLVEFYMATKVTEDKNAKIIVYCKTGGRSCLCAKTLLEMGYHNAVSMTGGWKAWEAAGYPID
jgi:rhodanese-related sulfurtransferase